MTLQEASSYSPTPTYAPPAGYSPDGRYFWTLNGWHDLARSPWRTPRPPLNHTLHAVLCIFTLGAWLPVWLTMIAWRAFSRPRIFPLLRWNGQNWEPVPYLRPDAPA